MHIEMPVARLEMAPSSLASKPGGMQFGHCVGVVDEQETSVLSTYPFLLQER
jgi:hypothetical protein